MYVYVAFTRIRFAIPVWVFIRYPASISFSFGSTFFYNIFMKNEQKLPIKSRILN
jgi:hypothetical protein